jgi:hypothetical protein
MSTYDLEEQEQLAELKAFWRLYGNLIVLAVAAALAVFAGYRIWHWYQTSQASRRSTSAPAISRPRARSSRGRLRMRAIPACRRSRGCGSPASCSTTRLTTRR